jgi:hypothetical protein
MLKGRVQHGAGTQSVSNPPYTSSRIGARGEAENGGVASDQHEQQPVRVELASWLARERCSGPW